MGGVEELGVREGATATRQGDAVAEADKRGRPVAIVRLGGRRLNPGRITIGNFGPGGPVSVIPNSAPTKKKAAPN